MYFKHLLSLNIITCFLLSYSSLSYSHQENTKASAISEGGRLYDKWWQEYGLKSPVKSHPAYPANGKKKGATTWRCKECHGWDYQGDKGAYSKGSHYTGIKGIKDFAEVPTSKIIKILKDRNHQYDSVMLEPGLQKIALFVSQGQSNASFFIDSKTKKARGDQGLGQHVFADKCVRCHGIDGKDINFKDANNPEFIGTVAGENPWEALHKIYNGHPGSVMSHHFMMHGKRSIRQRRNIGLIQPMESMPSMRDELSDKGIMHLLTYMQTLPKK